MRLVKLPWGDWVNPPDVVGIFHVTVEGVDAVRVKTRCGGSSTAIPDPGETLDGLMCDAAKAINGSADPYRTEAP